ncbi:MAG: sulfurtransferase [Rubrobacteraceae bacterium]|jgi:thiosulfate/3-mercaptopyruvate sulfurtransferase
MTMEQMSKPLVTSEELAQMMASGEKVVTIDVRDVEEYEAGHVPGAVNIPDVFYYLATTDPEGLKELQEKFATLFGQAGLTGEEMAVVYEEGFSLKSPRGYWLLEYLGYPKVLVLQGGMRGWRKGEYPVDTESMPMNGSPEAFPLDVDPSVLCTVDEMLASLDDPNVVKLDVRDKEEWVAESSSPYEVDFSPRKGRIPGATWIDWNLLLSLGEETKGSFKVTEDKGECKDLTEVEKMLEDKGVTKDRDVTLYCFKGARTSNTYLAMKMLGYENVKTYFGSWNEWSQDENLPIEQGVPEEEVA